MCLHDGRSLAHGSCSAAVPAVDSDAVCNCELRLSHTRALQVLDTLVLDDEPSNALDAIVALTAAKQARGSIRCSVPLTAADRVV